MEDSLPSAVAVNFFLECSYASDVPLLQTEFGDLSANWPRVVWAGVNEGIPTTFLGLIQIVSPRYKDNALCMASIAIKVGDGAEGVKLNLNLYDQLRQALSKKLKAGLWGVNTKFGGEKYYKDIHISDRAISEFQSGRELAPEGGDGFVRFQYRTPC